MSTPRLTHSRHLARRLAALALECDGAACVETEILAILQGGNASGQQLARVLGRMKSSTLEACRHLADTGRIVRCGDKWRLAEYVERDEKCAELAREVSK